mmetsp:Transcript_38359/g.59869  ORF Transcript_38359/g.59869 Transcript_38359/m.59869 type:complete len:338 (-) Transcript_38359:395-1408(-)
MLSSTSSQLLSLLALVAASSSAPQALGCQPLAFMLLSPSAQLLSKPCAQLLRPSAPQLRGSVNSQLGSTVFAQRGLHVLSPFSPTASQHLKPRNLQFSAFQPLSPLRMSATEPRNDDLLRQVAKMTEKEREERMAEIFASVDKDGSGSICADEMTEAFLTLNDTMDLKSVQKNVRAAFNMMDLDRNGQIDFDEFLQAADFFMDLVQALSEDAKDPHLVVSKIKPFDINRETTARLPEAGKESRIKELFESVDSDRSGSISVDELTKAFVKMNNKLDLATVDKNVRAAMVIMDLDGNGQIDYDEFRQAADIFEELSYEKPYVHSWYADTSGEDYGFAS